MGEMRRPLWILYLFLLVLMLSLRLVLDEEGPSRIRFLRSFLPHYHDLFMY